MAFKDYSNFVRPSTERFSLPLTTGISGEEARKLYIEEIKDAPNTNPSKTGSFCGPSSASHFKRTDIQLSDKELFLSAQSNDIDTLRKALYGNPQQLNVVDEYGWSLLMIACQANSIDVVKELLKRGIDKSIRDKAGNSASSLVVKNRNVALASILLDKKYSHSSKNKAPERHKSSNSNEVFLCEVCNSKTFPDKQEHLSSTIHNINASKGRKIPVNYAIPESNRGYQIMLKVGWDRESGLGRDGSGKKYPIKAVQKKDKKGLGHLKKEEKSKESENYVNRKTFKRDHQHNRKMEINFRREFY